MMLSRGAKAKAQGDARFVWRMLSLEERIHIDPIAISERFQIPFTDEFEWALLTLSLDE